MSRALLLAGFTTALVTLGCGQSPPTYDQVTIDAADQFSKIAAAHKSAYQKNRRPPTAEDLKPFLKQHGDPDTLLTSPRDKQPLVIVPVSPDMEAKGNELPIVAYERNGVNGRRITVDTRGTVVLVTDSEFAEMEFVGGHKPAR